MNHNEKECLVEKIRTQYQEREYTEVDALRELDKKVKRPAKVFLGIFGTISALVMGSGMSLIMTDIHEVIGMKQPMIPGIVIGVTGMIMAIINYPVYQRILAKRREEYAHKVIALCDKMQ